MRHIADDTATLAPSAQRPTSVDAHGPLAPAAPRARPLRGADWWIGPLLLCSSACGLVLVVRGPDRIFGVALACLVGAAVLWMLVSVFFPARADRTCPHCGDPGLRRLDPQSTRGVVCDSCGRIDREQSSFLMAEEEGAIEPIVMSERRGSK